MKLPSLLVLIAVASCAFAQKIQVKVEDTAVKFDGAPMQANGVWMVPIRNMINALGGTMKWDFDRQLVSGWANARRFDVTINSRDARVNEKRVIMDEPPFLHKGRIYVPLRFVAEAAGYHISQENGWYVLRMSKR